MAEDPANQQIIERVEQLAGELSAFDRLVDQSEQILTSAEISAEAARILGLRVADWYGKQLNDIASSERCLKRVVEIDAEETQIRCWRLPGVRFQDSAVTGPGI